MPTRHARIAVTRDPELDAAIRAAAPVIGLDKPQATLVRELILRGSRAALDDPEAELHRWLDARGAKPATRSTAAAIAAARALPPPAPGQPSLSEILEEQRADRI